MTYKVKTGDTLSKIAKRKGVTLAQLLKANPQLKANPNKIKVGDALIVPNGVSTAGTQPLQTTSSGVLGTVIADTLGYLSAKYETGGRGPGTVSTGSGDPGGVSYGSYQMATKTGTVARFVTQPGFPWLLDFQNLKPGTARFTAVWKRIAKKETAAFQKAQHEFIKKTHYDLLAAKILSDDGFNVDGRSRTLQDVVWSTSVQHGGASPIVHKALASLNVSPRNPDFDERLIQAIYAERGRKRPDGKLAYFSKSSPGVQAGVAKRFKNEERDALTMLVNEVLPIYAKRSRENHS